jgi:NAD-dependent SIR2 family protein deacetylase
VAKWKPSLFDHEKTAFSLKGAHERVKCAACHKVIREVDGKQVLFYLPTPKECAACHGPNVTK